MIGYEKEGPDHRALLGDVLMMFLSDVSKQKMTRGRKNVGYYPNYGS